MDKIEVKTSFLGKLSRKSWIAKKILQSLSLFKRACARFNPEFVDNAKIKSLILEKSVKLISKLNNSIGNIGVTDRADYKTLLINAKNVVEGLSKKLTKNTQVWLLAHRLTRLVNSLDIEEQPPTKQNQVKQGNLGDDNDYKVFCWNSTFNCE